MKQLSRGTYQVVKQSIEKEARTLEVAHLNKDDQAIIDALKQYQNDDGGFGHGLESDIRLPHSSAIATSVALQHLAPLDRHKEVEEMIQRAITYLEQTFDHERQGWFAVPKEVNEYPHAFWWSVHENGKSWIDDNWGNPSAELIGYLLKYPSFTDQLDFHRLVDQSLQHFMALETFESEHELYCYQRFFTMHPSYYSDSLQTQMKKAVQQVVVTDEEEWSNYVPFPLKFKPSPGELEVGVKEGDIDANLDYFVDVLENEKQVTPPWSWNRDEDVWPVAKQEWQGVLTLEVLTYLQNYERIES
ncbi:hypothetical protein H0266_09760 [Halobacillus locisalis]|uniref:Prenyltransferase n=1 Tax=Halobacillus locisalis TaxID=220753 RepID=A0A838CTF1_9BACI|nr:hypothetical protein [Halobacillus locisalis]MBA2175178.1 hypothetical protein [Halobacillus locisalis]